MALSARGRKALAEVGLEEKMLEHGIPMYARMIHDLEGNCKVIPYDRRGHQAIYSVGRKFLNEVLLDGKYRRHRRLRNVIKISHFSCGKVPEHNSQV